MRIVHLLATTSHGTLSPADVYSGQRGVTGSEQSMLYLARDSVQRGHRVVVYLPINEEIIADGVSYLDVRKEYPRLRELDDADVAVSWLSADALFRCPEKALRIHSIQINDWLTNANVQGNYPHVDVFLCVSEAQQKWLWEATNHPNDTERVEIVPNGVDLDRFTRSFPRVRHRLVYCSSPDRGLHWLLYFWPEIRLAYPDATLHVYYEIRQWFEATCHALTAVGQRARYVGERFDRFEPHGVIRHGAVSPIELANSLLRSDLMVYPCDPIAPTEGFSVATLENCAAGCVPVMTDADALGSIYSGSGAAVIPRKDGNAWAEQYLSELLRLMSDEAQQEVADRRKQVMEFAQQYSWTEVGKQFHAMIEKRLEMKRA